MNPFIARLISQQGQLGMRERQFIPAKFISPTRVVRAGKALLSFASADYLNLSWHPSVGRAMVYALDSGARYSNSSRLSAGTSEIHLRAETRLAQFFGVEAALLVASRSQACISLLSVLLNESDLLCFDDASESPLSDLALLLGCKTKGLEFNSRSVEKVGIYSGLKLAVLDSATSFDALTSGPETCYQRLLSQFDCLVLDETYALVGAGLRGAGIHEVLQFISGDYCLFGDLGISLPCPAGFLAGPATVIEQIKNRSRVLNLESSHPTHLLEGLIQALDLSEMMCTERVLLEEKRNGLSKELSKLLSGGRILNPIGPSIQLHFPSVLAANAFYDSMIGQGLLLDLVTFSGMGSRQAIVKIFLNIEHSPEDLGRLLQAVEIFSKRS